MDSLDIPIAFCKKCDSNVPVFIGTMPFDQPDTPMALRGMEFEVIICPECESILNLQGPITLTYYDLKDIEKVTNYKAATDE